MKLLRKKKLLEREHEKKENTIEHLTSVLTQIEQTDCSSLVRKKYFFHNTEKKRIIFFCIFQGY